METFMFVTWSPKYAPVDVLVFNYFFDVMLRNKQ